MNKEKVLVFSDCYIYGGSERLISFLLSNEVLNANYSLCFAFRNHKIYREGMGRDFDRLKIKILPLNLISNDTLFYKIRAKVHSRLLFLILRLPFMFFYYIGIYAIYNTFIFCRLLFFERPNIIHINNGGFPAARSCNLLVFIAKLFKIRTIIYQVNNQAQIAKKIDFIRNSLINKFVTRFITSSKMAKAALSNNVGIDIDKIGLVKNIVKLNKPVLEKKIILQDLGLEDGFLLVQVAFLTRRKGQINVLKALKHILEVGQVNNIHLLLIGDGEDKEELERFCDQHKLLSNVIFLGYKPNYTEYINIADIVLLPSIMNEDLPLVVIESLMLGKCMLSTSLAGIEEVIISGENGILISPNPDTIVGDLVKEILTLYHMPELIKKIGDNAENKSTVFSETVYGEQIKYIYSGYK